MANRLADMPPLGILNGVTSFGSMNDRINAQIEYVFMAVGFGSQETPVIFTDEEAKRLTNIVKHSMKHYHIEDRCVKSRYGFCW